VKQTSDDQPVGGSEPTTVFLLDDLEIVRLGLRALLTAESDIDVVGDAGTAASALDQIGALRPDVALLDVRLPDGDGLAVCREIRTTLPSTACLLLTWHSDDQALLEAIMAGAADYLPMRISGPDLVSAVRRAAPGRSAHNAIAQRLLTERIPRQTVRFDSMSALTDQEKRVLRLIGDGLTNRQIAERMTLAENTVKNYVASLLAKLGMHRRTQAAAFIARQAEYQDH
jgi:DNA-binding NarL/FixJ family response regulator